MTQNLLQGSLFKLSTPLQTATEAGASALTQGLWGTFQINFSNSKLDALTQEPCEVTP